MSTGSKLLDAAHATKDQSYYQCRAADAVAADAAARKLKPGDPGWGLRMMQTPPKTTKGT